jgi:hypothetical protein
MDIILFPLSAAGAPRTASRAQREGTPPLYRPGMGARPSCSEQVCPQIDKPIKTTLTEYKSSSLIKQIDKGIRHLGTQATRHLGTQGLRSFGSLVP